MQSNRIQGQATRGKTAANRLRQIDVLSLKYDKNVLTRRDGAFANACWLDLGFGAEPVTTLESAKRFRRFNSTLPVVGVEIDAERVALANQFSDELTQFYLGGFNFSLPNQQKVRAMRAYNVLRQYDETAVHQAYDAMCQRILPGGLLVEGTSNPYGRYSVTNLIRRVEAEGEQRCWQIEAMAFAYRFKSEFEIKELQTVLPKNLIHKVVPGQPIYQFFEAWKTAAAHQAHTKTWGNRQWFVNTAIALQQAGFNILLNKWWLRHGILLWRNPNI